MSWATLPDEVLAEVAACVWAAAAGAPCAPRWLLRMSHVCSGWRSRQCRWQRCSFLSRGLAGHWRFVGEAAFVDDAGNAKLVRAHDVCCPGTLGVAPVGCYARFTGKSFIEYDVSRCAAYGAQCYTVAIWVRPYAQCCSAEVVSSWSTAIGSLSESGTTRWLHFGLHSWTPGNYVTVPRQIGCEVGQVRLKSGLWAHLAAVVGDGFSVLYVDGKEQARTLLPPDAVIPHPETLFFGCQNKYHHNPWYGEMSDVCFWTRTLTPAEMRLIYVAGSVHHTDVATAATLPIAELYQSRA
eukprot:TRINITY_DN1705_c1_g1_i1.p1 TRINITY_DN1705_c1_g1~~TRINITY_DN1705_c1_g1_i1.p1  ORF type:complete len:319 (+),score=47.32 TRINITY_DN1705_c1_g1_i1:74-958(+)